jgi:hypothetical protein
MAEDARATERQPIGLLPCRQQAAAKFEFLTPFTSWHEMNQVGMDYSSSFPYDTTYK